MKSMGTKKVFSLAELLTDTTPTPPDIVTGFIPGRSVVILAGPGGDGKSYACLDLAFCVARGEDWLTLKTRKMPVLIIDLENRKYRLRDRGHQLISGHCLNVAPNVHFALSFDTALCRDESIAELVQLAMDCGAGLIILDSLIDFYGDADENSNVDMGQVAARLRAVTEKLDVSIVAIHHTPKANNNTPRGATALRNGVDVNIIVARSKSVITMKQDKNRAGPEVTLTATMNWQPGQFWLSPLGVVIGRQATQSDPDETAILEVLDDGRWYPSNEIVQKVMKIRGRQRSTIYGKLNALCKDGVLERKEQGRGKPYLVRLDPLAAAMQP